MACYNSSEYLDDAISSILNQTLSDLELILIDDCSTDNTIDIARRYQMQDDRVNVLSMPVNSGPASTRNTGIRIARGKWLAILDSDDVALPSRFEEQLRLADSDNNLIMIMSNFISMDATGRKIKEHTYPTKHKDLTERLYSMRAFPPHSSMMYRKSAVEKMLVFNPKYALSQDYDLWLRLSEIGRLASIDKPLVRVRKHNQNISNLEGGRRQACYGFAAAVCHYLRINHCPDPSAVYDETHWRAFILWIEQQLIAADYFEKQKAWTEARVKYFATRNRLLAILRFGNHLLKTGHFSGLMWNKFFGSSLPKCLAQEWMKRPRAVQVSDPDYQESETMSL